jgi:hypothetical protein
MGSLCLQLVCWAEMILLKQITIRRLGSFLILYRRIGFLLRSVPFFMFSFKQTRFCVSQKFLKHLMTVVPYIVSSHIFLTKHLTSIVLFVFFYVKWSPGAAVKLLSCDHEVMSSSPRNSLLQKCRGRHRT